METEIAQYQENINNLRELEKSKTVIPLTQKSKFSNKTSKAKLHTGLLPLKGRGIKVVIDDNQAGLRAAPNDDPNRYIIHYENILNIITELKLGRASYQYKRSETGNLQKLDVWKCNIGQYHPFGSTL